MKIKVLSVNTWMGGDGSESTERRQLMVRSLNQLFAQTMSSIIAGDSNATPDNPCWENLTHAHSSVFGNRLKTTFNMRRKKLPGCATAAVDIFLTSPELKVVSAECQDVDISDHLPMVVELETR